MKKLTRIPGACAIIALRYAANTTDEKALKTCIAQGMFDEQWQKAAESLKLKLNPILSKPVILKRFMKKYPEGMFIMATHNHLFVVDDGKIYDPGWGSDGLSRKILQAYAVIS